MRNFKNMIADDIHMAGVQNAVSPHLQADHDRRSCQRRSPPVARRVSALTVGVYQVKGLK